MRARSSQTKRRGSVRERACHKPAGNDALSWMGVVNHVNALDVGLDMDTRTEADQIFTALTDGGTIEYGPLEIFSVAYYGGLVDKFGVIWVVTCLAQP